MKALKYLSFVGKLAGFVSAMNVIPFVDPKIGVIVFNAASIPKDRVNRIGDLVDDGQANQSFRAWAMLLRKNLRNTCAVRCDFAAPFRI